MSLRIWLILGSLAFAVSFVAGCLLLWALVRGFEQAIAHRIASVCSVPAAGAPRTDLPPLLNAYVARARLRDAGRIRWTRIEQRGEMRLAADGAWLPLTAIQHSAAAHPAFLWRADVRMAPAINAVVIDGLVEGQGILEARLFGAVPLAKSSGLDTLKGELQRYLAEIPWNPSAIAVNPAIRWRQVDARRVAAQVEMGGVTAQAELHFDEAGDIVGASATDRPMGMDGKSIPTAWHGAFSGYREVNGLRLPTRAVVWWDLPSGRFEYWRGEVVAVSWE